MAEAARPEERVDAHHHLWDLAVRPEPWIDPVSMAPIARSFPIDELKPLARKANVRRTVVVQTVSAVEETVEFLATAAAEPLVGAVTGWVDLTAPEVADSLAWLGSRPGGEYLRAIRHQVQDEPDADWLDRPDVRRGIRAVSGAGLAYELLVTPRELPAATRLVGALGETQFVLDHCAKPPIASGALEPWAGGIRALAGFPNVVCKISGLVTEADWSSWSVGGLRPYVEVVLDAFGPERLMLGSDWPVCTLAAAYGAWMSSADALLAELSAGERAAVLRDTATRTYALA